MRGFKVGQLEHYFFGGAMIWSQKIYDITKGAEQVGGANFARAAPRWDR